MCLLWEMLTDTDHGPPCFPSCPSQPLSAPQNRVSCTSSPWTAACSYRRADMVCRCSCYLQSNHILKRPVKLSVVLNKWSHSGLMWVIFTPAFIWIHFFSSCQAFRSKKFFASRMGLAWHTSLANVCHYTWQKYLASSSKDLFIQMQIGTFFHPSSCFPCSWSVLKHSPSTMLPNLV